MRRSRSSDASVQARRQSVLEHVLELRSVSIEELSTRFSVSEMTVHRDLTDLAAAGLLRKERGRAVAPSRLTVQTSALFRLRAGRHTKAVLARAALDRLGEVGTLLVDDSTSVLPLLPLLGRLPTRPATGPVTVVTNYLEAVRRASRFPSLRPHLLGGDYVPDLDATFGPTTLEALGRCRVDVAVVGVPAVEDGRCYHALADSAALKTCALEVADRSILVVDHTKLGHTGPYLMFDVGRFDTVVTDDAADPTEVAAMRARGADVIVVPCQPLTPPAH